jgi:threonine dehydrogenase-like Zn-dependent dehydrogenase
MRGLFCDPTGIHLRKDLANPVPIAGEIRLAVIAAGICDTDLQLARGYMGFRGILGHEFVGRTEDGQRVTAEINNSCGKCATCAQGQPNHCPNRTVLGILDHDGAMADTICVPAVNVHEIPDSISDEEAVLIEPLAAALRIPEQLELRSNTRLAVVGDGKLGLLCTWVAKLAGASVSLVGKHEQKLALAGAGVQAYQLSQAPGMGKSFDVVVDCTGSPSGLETALGLVRPCGTVVLKTTIAGPHQTSLAPIVIDEVRVVGSRCGPFPKAIAALAERRIDVRPLIGAEFPLDEAEAAFRAAAAPGARKIILRV